MKTILYGHAWLSGALTAFAFFGLVRAFNDITWDIWPWQISVWASAVAVGLLWTLLGFSYVARRDWEGGDADEPEEVAPRAGTGRPAEEVASPSHRRVSWAAYVAPLIMLLTFLAVVVLMAAAAGRLSRNTGRLVPRPLVPHTGRR